MVSVCGSDVALPGTDEQSDSASAVGAIVPVHGVPLTVVPALDGTVTDDDAGVDASPGSASPTASAVRPVTVSSIWERTYAGTRPPELMVRAYALPVRFPAEGNRNLASPQPLARRARWPRRAMCPQSNVPAEQCGRRAMCPQSNVA